MGILPPILADATIAGFILAGLVSQPGKQLG